MKLFVTGVGAAAACWGVMYAIPSGGPGAYNNLDRFIVHEIAFAFAYAAVVMVISRTRWSLAAETWTFRAVGLFLTSVGTALLMGISSYLSYKSPLDPQAIDPGLREAWLDAARVSLGLGGAIVIIGLTMYLVERFSPHRNPMSIDSHQWSPEETDRRQNGGRRSYDPQETQ